ncbi:DUF4349 domain-containing protein [Micromonospora sp. WMMD812]|uniref:DUF4349 domain-containing protein n=1 Tax=Micromonospora sp. WMMD812 TaxID=3015152 RepID=UPI00248C3F9B|nr:DUF4349 domain-containing protein [Micromonospora sp. WMMD812]WBB65034.1 DUF4349 domain-containing protein [Micromonospora sp. WMMD812]
MDGRRGRRRGVPLAALGLVAVLAVGGCGGVAGQSDSGTSNEAPAAGAADRDAAEGGAPGAPGAGAPGAGAPAEAGSASADLRVDQRSIIYTGTMLVRVDDVDAAARRAVTVVTGAGGFVGGDQRSSSDADARAELQLRVPAARFTGVIEELAGLGRQERREIQTEDVTEETIDLDARIATQRARVESGRRLLARATTIGDLVSLEGELAKREADLASLEAKKRRLADLTALSTITLTLVGSDVSTADEETELGFLVGLHGGWKVFLVSMTIMLTVLGAVLPWLIVFGVPVTVLIVALRRRRNRRTAPPVSAPPPVPAARSAP